MGNDSDLVFNVKGMPPSAVIGSGRNMDVEIKFPMLRTQSCQRLPGVCQNIASHALRTAGNLEFCPVCLDINLL